MKYAEYSNYKFSGTEWIGDIPSEWECRRLKDCGALLAGAGFPHEYQGLEDEELPFYKVGDLSQSLDGRHMASGKHTISRATAYTLRAKVIPPSAIVYAKIGAALFLNRRRITVKNCCIDNNMTAFIPNQQKLSTAWANYWLCTLDFGEFTNPGAVPSLSEGYQATLPITLPPLDEQQIIARFLDAKTAQIDALVAQKRQLIAKLKEKRSALIARTVTRGLPPEAAKAAGLEPHSEMKDSGVEWMGVVPKTWEVIPLKWRARCSSGDGIATEDVETNETTNSNIPVIGGNGLMGYAAGSNIDHQILVIGRVGALCGNVHIVNPPAWITDNALVLRPKTGVFDNRYLAHVLRFRNLNDIAAKTAQPLITGTQVRDQRVPCPSIPEQIAMADFLDSECLKLDGLSCATETAIGRLTEYRQALITSAVTGKIDVREPA